MNGCYFWRNFNSLPEREPGPLNLGLYAVAWMELLGFAMVVAWTLRHLVILSPGGDPFHSAMVSAVLCDSFAADLHFARRFSALLLLGLLSPEEALRRFKASHKTRLGHAEREGSYHCLATLGALVEATVHFALGC